MGIWALGGAFGSNGTYFSGATSGVFGSRDPPLDRAIGGAFGSRDSSLSGATGGASGSPIINAKGEVVVFEVARNATKVDVRRAVEKLNAAREAYLEIHRGGFIAKQIALAVLAQMTAARHGKATR